MRIRGNAIGMSCILAVLLAGWSWWKIGNWSEHHPRPAHLVSNPLWAQIAAANNLPPAEASKVTEAVVAGHIPVGTSFQEVERLLQAAGFNPSSIQKPEYKEYWQANIGPTQFFSPCSTRVHVKLYPSTAGKFDTVTQVATTDYTLCL